MPQAEETDDARRVARRHALVRFDHSQRGPGVKPLVHLRLTSITTTPTTTATTRIGIQIPP